jgi:hypothetical protein
MVYSKRAMSPHSYLITPKVKDLKRCMADSDLPEENRVWFEQTIAAMNEPLPQLEVHPDAKRPFWNDHLTNIRNTESMVQITADLQVDLQDSDKLAQLANPTREQKLTMRRLKDAIALNTTALSERIWEKDALRSHELNLYQEQGKDRSGHRLKDYRNEIAHTWKSLVRDDNLRYKAANHYAWLRAHLPVLSELSRQYLCALLSQVNDIVAYETALWETEFCKIAEQQERDRQEELRQKQLAYCPPPCECLEDGGWQCKCAVTDASDAVVVEWDFPAPPLDYHEDILGNSSDEDYSSDEEPVFDSPEVLVETEPPAAQEHITVALASSIANELGSPISSHASSSTPFHSQEQSAHPQPLHFSFPTYPTLQYNHFLAAQMHPLLDPASAMDIFALTHGLGPVPTVDLLSSRSSTADVSAPASSPRKEKRKSDALGDFQARLKQNGVKLGSQLPTADVSSAPPTTADVSIPSPPLRKMKRKSDVVIGDFEVRLRMKGVKLG